MNKTLAHHNNEKDTHSSRITKLLGMEGVENGDGNNRKVLSTRIKRANSDQRLTIDGQN